MAGRPTVLTPEIRALICEAVAECYSYESAAALAGIHPSTLYRWKQRGAAARSGAYKEFCEELEIAEGLAEGELTKTARKKALEDGTFALELLSRKWPKRWARRVYKPQDEGTGGSITVIFRRPDIDPADKGDTLGPTSTEGKASAAGPPPGPGRAVAAKGNGNGNGK